MNKQAREYQTVRTHNNLPLWKRILHLLIRLSCLALIILLIQQGETMFRVKNIEINGPEGLDSEEIVDISGIREGMSIFLVNEQEVAGRIRDHLLQVKKVEISRNLPDTIVLHLFEREVCAYIIIEDGFWMIDRESVCFEQTDHLPDNYPVLSGIDRSEIVPGVPIKCPVKSATLSEFFAAWNNRIDLELIELDFVQTYNLVAYTACGSEIWFGDQQSMGEKVSLVQQSIPYIKGGTGTILDVRSGNRLAVFSSLVIEEMGVDP